MTAQRRGRAGGGLPHALAALVLLGACCGSAWADDAAARGRRLFETGVGRDGRAIAAVLGHSSTPVPGALLSCAGCHGKDGRGRSVAGVAAADITWQALSKPYAVRVTGGRVRPAYTEPLLLQAVTIGRDSGGELLSPVMPRFRLTPGDGADLIAYLRKLGSGSEPGVTAEMISIGVALPRRRDSPAAHDPLRSVLDAYVQKINREGGIFAKRVQLSFVEPDASPEGASAGGDPAGTGSFLAMIYPAVGAEPDLAAASEREGVPIVALSAGKAPLAGDVFYLSAGSVGELGALAREAARRLDAVQARLAVLYRDDEDGRRLTTALRAVIDRNAWQSIEEIPIERTEHEPDRIQQALHATEACDAVLLATPDAGTAALISGMRKAGRRQLVLLPGSATAPEWLPQENEGNVTVLVGFEFGGLSPTPAALQDYHAFARENGLPDPPLPVQRAGLTALKLLIEGLRRAGRDVTRTRLVEAIETIQHFETGYLPPLNYGPRRHIGFAGAQIVPFDAAHRQLMEPLGRIDFQ